MKLSYYGYSVLDVHKNEYHLQQMSEVVSAFCKYNNPAYKNNFVRGAEHLYLLNVVGNLYLFIQTKNEEIIKKVNSDDISAHEITDDLEDNESIGFASYVYFDKHFIGFASTVYAPRVTAFCDFMDFVIESILGKNIYKFITHPFKSHAEKQEVLDKPFIGKSTMVISKNSSLFDDFLRLLNGNAQAFEKVNSFEIIIKPEYKANIADAVKPIISSTESDQFQSFIVMAKTEQHDALKDYYLEGEGLISDTIKRKSDETKLKEQISKKIEDNIGLAKKVAEHEADDEFTKLSIDGINRFVESNAWTNHFSSLSTLSVP